MTKIIQTLVSLFLLMPISARAADTPSQIPADVRWRESLDRFFFINSGDTTDLYQAFARATLKWHPDNFRIEMTGDASNNQACIIRRPNSRKVNIVYFNSVACKQPFGPGVLAVTSVQ
jgi:hypothetical protein